MNTFKKLISMLFLFAVLFSMAACNKNNGVDSNSTVDLKERTGKPLTQEELNKIMPPSFFEDPDGDGLLASNPQWLMAKTMQTQRLSSRVLPAIRAGVGSGKKILFHTRINAQWLAFTSSLHQLLADNGYEVVIHADDTPLTASDVADIDVLAITNTLGSPDPETGIDRPLSFAEKNLIKNFVASGKGFFFTGDWVNYNLPEFNDVSQMFGITFALQYIDYIPIVEDGFITYYWVPEWYAYMFDVYSYYSVYPSQPIMRKAPFNGYSWFVNPDHEIFKDVNRILIMGASFINPKEFGVAAVQTHPITGRPRDWPISADSSSPVITALEHGSGRVVISGDTNCFGNDGFATSVTAGTDNQRFASNVFNWLAKTASTTEFTSLEIRYDGDSSNLPNNIELSSLKDIKTFKAIGFFGATEKDPVKVNWTLESGDVPVSQVLRNGILTNLNSNVGKIGVFSTSTGTASALLDSETVKFVSLLSGNINLVASASNISKTISIRLKQPTITINLSLINEAGSCDILPLWKEVASNAWGTENLIKVNFRSETPSSIPNANFSPLVLSQFESLEDKLPFLGSPIPDLLQIISFDFRADTYYTSGTRLIYTRQNEELLSRGRGEPKDINVSITKILWSSRLTNLFTGAPEEPLGGWTACSEDSYKRQFSPPPIDEPSQSGIGLSNPTSTTPDKVVHMAHEIGHILIQHGDEHENEGVPWNSDNLMILNSTGQKLEPIQFIHALRLNRPTPNYFIVEE